MSDSINLISSMEAHDAFFKAQAMGHQPYVYRIAVDEILDAEGGLEILRLCRHHGYPAHVILPLDASVVLQAARIGCMSLGIQVSIPEIENGVKRSELLRYLVSNIDIPVWAYGAFEATDVSSLVDIGFNGLLISDTVSFEEQERFTLHWSLSHGIKKQ